MSFRASPITRDKYLTGPELRDLFAWLWAHRHDPPWTGRIDLVRLILGSGLRVSEAAVLRKPEDCHEDGILHVRKSKTGRQRTVRVSPEYLPWYQAKWSKAPDGLWFPREPVNGRQYSGPYTTRTLQLWWIQVLRAAGLRDLSIHGGRHTYATWELASRRLHVHEVQSQLGHSDVEMTLGFYSHAVVECLYQSGPPEWWSIAADGPKQRDRLVAV